MLFPFGKKKASGSKEVEQLHLELAKNNITKVVSILEKNKHLLIEKSDLEQKQNAWHIVATIGTPETFDTLLKFDPQLQGFDVTDSCGHTPLLTACRDASLIMIERFLSKSSVSAKNSERNTCLHLLLKRNDLYRKDSHAFEQVFASCLKKGGEKILTAQNSNHENLIHVAAGSDMEAITHKLCDTKEAKTLVQAVTKLGESPLHYAARSGNMNIAKLLLEKGAPISLRGEYGTAPVVAGDAGHRELAEFLWLQFSNEKSHQPKNPFQRISLMLSTSKKGTSTAESSNTLHGTPRDSRAASQSTENLHACYNEEDYFNELQGFAETGNLDQWKRYLEENRLEPTKVAAWIDPGTQKSLLMIACMYGSHKIADFLLSNKADWQLTDKTGWTPLHFAACAIGEATLLLILKRTENAEINKQNSEKNTALHFFCKNTTIPKMKIPEILRMFREKGADFKMKNSNGETPLHNACMKGNLQVVKTLLEPPFDECVDVNAQNVRGETPLHWAVRTSHTDIVNLLVEEEAKMDIRGDCGTPLELALELHEVSPQMIRLLGGDPDKIEKEKQEAAEEENSTNKKPSKLLLRAQTKKLLIQSGSSEKKLVPKQSIRFMFMKDIEKQKNQNNQTRVSDVSEPLDLSTWESQKFHWILDPEEVEMGDYLGSGQFAKVYKGTFRGQKVALKVLTNLGAGAEELKGEFNIMSSLKSPNVVYFFGLVTNPLCLVMQFCEKGSLASVIRDDDYKLSWNTFFQWAHQSISGVQHLHCWKPRIIHRDLKSLNLLIDEYDNCKIADFGISRYVSEDNATTLAKLRGTFSYCAPELYLGQKATPQTDVFSLAVLAWEMMMKVVTGVYSRPYSEYPHLIVDFQIIIQVAKNELRPKIPSACPQILADMIHTCWSQDPTKRPDTFGMLEMLENAQEEVENLQNNKK